MCILCRCKVQSSVPHYQGEGVEQSLLAMLISTYLSSQSQHPFVLQELCGIYLLAAFRATEDRMSMCQSRRLAFASPSQHCVQGLSPILQSRGIENHNSHPSPYPPPLSQPPSQHPKGLTTRQCTVNMQGEALDYLSDIDSLEVCNKARAFFKSFHPLPTFPCSLQLPSLNLDGRP